MRKAVKSLVIAASVAAVAGIGAVSFAQWSASTSGDSATGNTATINTVGAVEVTSNNLDSKSLVPYDQDAQNGYVSTSHVKVWAIEVSVEFTGTAPTLSVTTSLSKGSSGTDVGEAALYVYKGAATLTDDNVESNVDSSPSTDSTNWVVSTRTDISVDGSGEATIYIILDASDTDAMGAELTATISVNS